MAKMLTADQGSRIKALIREFAPYADKGWLCESSDAYGPCNVFFNNDTDEMFWSDCDGNILDGDVQTLSPYKMGAMARIQGMISKIAAE
ncbi:MAG: hypothetical protein K6G10_01490 [Butyrivibrio sp.]|nr:hypothetical protein [Butyrivibrio sp.]